MTAAAKKATTKKAESHADRTDRLAAKQQAQADAREQAVRDDLQMLEDTIKQREWLLICRRLNVRRQEIAADAGLRMIALAWVRQQRTHGGADWEKLLDMTDDEIVGLLGYDADGNPLTDTPA